MTTTPDDDGLVRWNTEHEDDDLSDVLAHPFADVFAIALDRQGWKIVPQPQIVAENEASGAVTPRWPIDVPVPGVPCPLWADNADGSDIPLQQFLERRRKQ